MKEKIIHPKGVRISSRWLKPAVAIGTGTTHLVITVTVPKRKGSSSRAPLDVAFVIDRSGSMSGEPLELAKRGVIEAIQMLDALDIFTVIGYDDRIQEIFWPQEATSEHKQIAVRRLCEVHSGGSTNLFGGWLHGVERLMNNGLVYTPGTPTAGSRLKRTILLSDGLANVGETNPGRIAEHVSRYRRLGMTTSTLGLGAGVDDMLLTAMAEAGGGNYAFATSPRDLPAFFARELGEALQISASGMELTLTLPKGVRANLLDPFAVEREGKQLKIWIGDLPAGMTLNLVFEVTTRANDVRTYPAIEVGGHWRGTRGARREQLLTADPLMAMSAADFDSMPADPDAHVIVAEKISAQARRESSRLYHEGHATEARLNLRNAKQTVAAAPNAAALAEDLDNLYALDESAPDFEIQRRVFMTNAHREARGRER